MSPLTAFAPAKLNLYLHITGRRADLYHDLDSLAAFTSVGDTLRLQPAAAFAFRLEGPQAVALQGEDPNGNLAVKAVRTLAALADQPLDFELTLSKHLPVASGIGGGSSDAAAALRLAARHWHLDPHDPRLAEAAAQHGQDVPLCLTIQNAYLTASGTAKGPQLPHCDIVLVNPNKGLATPLVYKTYRESGAGFSPAAQLLQAPPDVTALVILLKERHNDLYAPACRLMPEIADIIAALDRTEGCLLARMSGSGATCFGIYADCFAARQAAAALMQAHPDWWVVPASLPYLPPAPL